MFNNCTEDLWRHGARTRGYPQYETYDKCNRVLAQARFYQSQQEELQFLLRQPLNHDLYSVLPELNQTPSMYNMNQATIINQLIGQTNIKQNLLLKL